MWDVSADPSRNRAIARALVAFVSGTATAMGHSADVTAATTPTVEADGAHRFRDPQDEQIDLSRFLANAHGFLPTPIVVTEPAVGYGGGAIGMFLRPRSQAGEQGWARPNISAIGALATENGTQAAFAADASRWRDGHLETLAGGGAGHVNLDFYGLGRDDDAQEPVRYSLDFGLAFVQGSWHFDAKSPWSFGLRYVYAQVEPQLRDPPLSPALADRVDVVVSAPAGVLEFDSRDNVFTPTRGVYAESVLLASLEDLGANDEFERFQQTLMVWYPLRDDITLGLRGDYQRASDETPFFLRPYVKLRGVPAMRYQGDWTASAEIEMRWQFRGRWSAIAAAGVGTARTSGDAADTQDLASGAVGFRYELARKFGLHAGMDIAASSETTAVYFQIGNAWFRP
jgi:hypothetical protein